MAYKEHSFLLKNLLKFPASYMSYADLKFAIVGRNLLPGNSY